MITSNTKLEIVKQLFSSLSNYDKKLFLKSIKSKAQINEQLNFSRELKECPHCKSVHFKKNGTTYPMI